MPRRIGLALLALCLPLVLRAAQPQFWRIEGSRDFLEGTTEGITVDSEGRVRLSPASSVVHDPEAPYVWCLARDKSGPLYAGTGNDGKVFRIESGKASLFYDAPELEVHALVSGTDGRLYVGTSPDGKVYAVDGKGVATPFYDPAEKYIWALAFDASGNLLVATGADGKIYRVDKKGNATLLFASPDTHVISLAVDERENVYAGSSPGGVVYRIDKASKAFVLHDSAYREVKALEVGSDGSVYAALVDGKDESPRPGPTLPTPPPPAASGGTEITVSETFAFAPPAGVPPLATGRPADLVRSTGTKGAVQRLLPSGEVETLWTSTDDMPQSLLWTEGGLLLGTGNKGKIYRVRDDRTWAMMASFPSDQVTALHRGAAGAVFVATSNPAKVYALEGRPGPRGTFTSKVKDTDTVSGWGRLRWEGSVPEGTAIQVETRSGNTGAPDSTWSEWSAPYARKDGDPVTTERARFLQVRAILTGKDGTTPVLESISTAYLQRNLRPQVTSINVHPPGEVFQKPLAVSGEIEILGLETGEAPEPRPGGSLPRPAAGPITSYSRKLYQRGIQTFSWRAEDPNADTLVYDVYYRAARDSLFRLLRKGLTDAVLAWDTSTVPNGRYVLKVVARDTPSNPEALALAGDKESLPFEVDNTPPSVVATLGDSRPARVRAVVRDDSSLIRKAEYSVDGGRWHEVHPIDGINDAMEETYEIQLPELAGPPPHLVVVRATDLLGNVASARVEVE